MTHNRHIRCWLSAALIAAAALSLRETERPPARAMSLARLALRGHRDVLTPRLPLLRAIAPRPFEAFALNQYLRDSIVTVARAQVGRPYVLGGMSPKRGFDCSGLIRYVIAQVHMDVPRTAHLQSRVGLPITVDKLQPGDLLAFGEGKIASHVGIYVGAGKFVHASSIAGRVVVSPLRRRPSRLIRPMRGARRLLATADPFARASGG